MVQIESNTDWREAPAHSGDFELKVAGIAVLAFALRLFAAWVSLRQPGGWFSKQGLEMSFMADSLAHGHGLASPFGGQTGPTAMFAPVYPFLVSLFFRVFGSYSAASAAGIVFFQIFIGLAVLASLMYFARWQFNDRVATIAGLIWTLSPPLWWVPTIFWDTSITILLVIGLLIFALWLKDEPSLLRWVFFGVYIGATGVCNPALVPTMLCMLLVLMGICVRSNGRQMFARAAVSTVAFLLVFSVWPIRNERVLHAFVPLRTAPGVDLWMGNHPGASGCIEIAEFPIYNRGELLKYEQEGEVAYTREKGDMAKRAIAADPGTFIRLTLTRVARFWLGSGSRDGAALFVLHATLTSICGAAGLWILIKRRRWTMLLLVAVPLILFPLPYYITHAEFRFRLVVDSIMILLSAYALATLTDRVRRTDLKEA